MPRESLYPSFEEQPNPQDNETATDEPTGDQPSNADSALLPLSLFGQRQPRPGETITLTVTRSFEDEVEVTLTKKKRS